jgi:hypothetical protein
MIKDLKNAIKKLRMNEKQKMIAGNQLTQSEKETLVTLSAILLSPLLIAGVIIFIYNINL